MRKGFIVLFLLGCLSTALTVFGAVLLFSTVEFTISAENLGECIIGLIVGGTATALGFIFEAIGGLFTLIFLGLGFKGFNKVLRFISLIIILAIIILGVATFSVINPKDNTASTSNTASALISLYLF